MSARDDLYHGGVLRVAGVVHVGNPARQARNYVSDARGYARGLMIEHHIEEARRLATQGDECQCRSWVCAVEQLVRWLDAADRQRATEPHQSPSKQGETCDRKPAENRPDPDANRGRGGAA